MTKNWEDSLVPSNPVSPSFAETHGEKAALKAYKAGRRQARVAAMAEAGAFDTYVETRTVHSVTIPGHGLFRAYDEDVESILARYSNPRDNGRRAMLRDVNEIAAPEDYADVSTSSLAIILASFTPGSSAL